MSLWSVPDKETLELMNLVYTKWLAGAEKHEALKQAQLAVREEVKRDHDGRDLPFYPSCAECPGIYAVDG
jgi:CHAT domain-containing protein